MRNLAGKVIKKFSSVKTGRGAVRRGILNQRNPGRGDFVKKRIDPTPPPKPSKWESFKSRAKLLGAASLGGYTSLQASSSSQGGEGTINVMVKKNYVNQGKR